jgi:hypothetical protein
MTMEDTEWSGLNVAHWSVSEMNPRMFTLSREQWAPVAVIQTEVWPCCFDGDIKQ